MVPATPGSGINDGRPIARMIRKRIKVDAQDQQDEMSIPTTYVNELRILSLVPVRENVNIVKLIDIRWEEQPNDDHFEPGSFLELGSLLVGTLGFSWTFPEDARAS